MMKRRRKPPIESMSKEEIFAKLNASAERTLEALQKAYEAGLKEGFEAGEEDQLIELLRRAKAFRDKIRKITEESLSEPETGSSGSEVA